MSGAGGPSNNHPPPATTGAPPPGASSTMMNSSERSQESTGSTSNVAPAISSTTTPTKTTATATTTTTTSPLTKGGAVAAVASHVTDQAVLDYLKSKGMGNAVLELQRKLKDAPKTMREHLEHDDDLARNQRLALTKSTGGGFGYDRDAAAPIVQWGVPDNTGGTTTITTTSSSGGGEEQKSTSRILGEEEARSYLDAYCALQLWVLTLPDDSTNLGGGVQVDTHRHALVQAQELIRQGAVGLMDEDDDDDSQDGTASVVGEESNQQEETKESGSANTTPTKKKAKKVSLSSLIAGIAKPSQRETDAAHTEAAAMFHLPPSAKPELLAVTFALLIHTYCELLEVGMETTAHILRDAFKPIYEPLYGEQLKDLYHCTTTEDMVKLNTHNSQHMEALANLKSILVQIASLQLRKEEVSQAQLTEPAQKQAQIQKLKEYHHTIQLLQQKHNELSQRASQAFDRMYDLPFLRRARAVRWQLTLSSASYGLLCSFLSSTSVHSSLLSMSTLLQTKCELHVERRDPLPFTPACVLDDQFPSKSAKRRKEEARVLSRDQQKQLPPSSSNLLNQSAMVAWAAPLPRSTDEEDLPFPKYHLDEEYEDETSAKRDKRRVFELYEHHQEAPTDHNRPSLPPPPKDLPIHQVHAYPCPSTHSDLPGEPYKWPQAPVMLRPTPRSHTRIRGIRHADSTEYRNYAGFCAGCLLPINTGAEAPGKSLIIDFETIYFVGTLLLHPQRKRNTKQAPHPTLMARNNDFKELSRVVSAEHSSRGPTLPCTH